MLDAHLALRVGDFHLDVALRADAGEVVAVLGPNGAGKTTLLRALAGLQPAGRVSLGGRTLDGLPPEKRSIGVVFQEYLLFPHLSVRDNVAFGASRAAADAWLERVGLADRAAARPAELSGGQAQRVALARALAREPDLLLLDEPLAALDAGTRNEIRRELHRHLADFAGVAVLVTHDPVDAFALADRVVVLERGRIVQEGPPADLGSHPRSRYVADLVGTNLVTGTCRDGVVDTGTGGLLVVASVAEGPVLAVISPSAVSLHRRPPEGSPRNVWQGRITSLDRLVDRVHVHVDGPVPVVSAVVPAAVDALGLRPGEEVWVAIKATEIVVHPV